MKAISDEKASPTAFAAPLPGFVPQHELWEGEEPMFPSQTSAQWFIRDHREALIKEEAIALFRGFVYVRKDAFLKLGQQVALDAYRRRYAAGGKSADGQ